MKEGNFQKIVCSKEELSFEQVGIKALLGYEMRIVKNMRHNKCWNGGNKKVQGMCERARKKKFCSSMVLKNIEKKMKAFISSLMGSIICKDYTH